MRVLSFSMQWENIIEHNDASVMCFHFNMQKEGKHGFNYTVDDI